MHPKIRCIYSTASPFADYGTGIIAYYAVRGLYRVGMLNKLLCISHKKSEIPENLIRDVFPGKRITARALEKAAIMLSSANGYGMRNIIYDNLTSSYINNCDIFHGWALESVKSLLIAKRRGVRFTILERSSSHILKQKSILEAEYKKYNIRKTPIDNIEIERNIFGYENADYVIVPSDFAYDSFIELGFPPKKLIKIPYGYDPDFFKPAPLKNNGTFRVLFCGNITLRKGIIYLLEAWDRLNFKNSELLIIGHIFNEAKNILRKYINRNSSIIVKNFMPYKEIVNQYQRADIFVFPSLEEGSALVNYEAMACALPVITTFNSGSVVRNGVDGFIIEPKNIEQLCEKLQYLYENEQKRRQMGENALAYIKNYTWEKYSEKLCNFYYNLFKT